MARLLHFVTHPEVEVEPTTPVPEWGLSPVGRHRLEGLVRQPWVSAVGDIFSSEEVKAREAAVALSQRTGVPVRYEQGLGENDRSSTGFLPARDFEVLVDRFFGDPAASVQGWETAQAAQERIVTAVHRCLDRASSGGDIAIVSHGAVGTLLWCHLRGVPITRRHDEPGQGSHYAVDLQTLRPRSAWQRIPLPEGP